MTRTRADPGHPGPASGQLNPKEERTRTFLSRVKAEAEAEAAHDAELTEALEK